MQTFEQKYIVELADITSSFSLKSTAILRYYQETFARYCAKYHVAGYDVYKMGLKWVLGQTVVKFFDIIPIWNEEVTAKVYITNIKKLRLYMNFEITTKRGIVAKGQTVLYTLDLETSRPKPIEPVSSHFEIDDDNLNGEILKPQLINGGNLISEQEHTITFSDIDYNNHTNNISYIALAMEGMSAKYVQEKYPALMDIKYLQETFLKDTLKCEIYKQDDNFTFCVKNLKDNSDVCVINSYWGNQNMSPADFFNILENT